MTPARLAAKLRFGDLSSTLSLMGLLYLSAAAHATEVLFYAPLPMENSSVTQARNQPLADLLSKLLGREVRLQLSADHAELVDAVVAGKVHFAELGPLPFLLARERAEDLLPLATFREPDDRADYRCVIVAPVDGVVDLTDLIGKEATVTVALTRRQSTCGPAATFSLLAELGLDLSGIYASYQGGHDDVAVAVLREQFLIGGVKESVAHSFYGIGLRVLAASEPVPGFVLVAREGLLDDGQWQSLSRALSEMDDADLQQLQNGRHGFAPFEEQRFDAVDAMRRLGDRFVQRVTE